MGGKTKRKKELTLDDLAVMVKDGFDEQGKKFDLLEGQMEKVEGRMEKVEGRLGKVEDGLDNLWTHTAKLTAEVNNVKIGQEELKDIVSGVYRVEIRDLKNGVEVLEKKAGIA